MPTTFAESPKAARTNDARLLANAGIAARIEQLQQEAAERNELRLDDVIEQLRRIGFRDPARVMVGGQLRPLDDIEPEMRAAIAVYKRTTREWENGQSEHVAEVRFVNPAQGPRMLRNDQV